MPVGTEWVRFVYWNSQVEEFEVMHFEDARSRQGEPMATADRQPFAEEWHGRPASEFLAAMVR